MTRFIVKEAIKERIEKFEKKELKSMSEKTKRAYKNSIVEFEQHLDILGLTIEDVKEITLFSYRRLLEKRGLKRETISAKMGRLFRYLEFNGWKYDIDKIIMLNYW